MADVSIVNQTVTPAPNDYTVPGTQSLALKSVRAAIDGSGAATAFLPALQLLDPAGHVMWTAVDTSTTVAAAGSADVSWFPGVKGGGGGIVVGAAAYAQGFDDTPQILPAGGSLEPGFATVSTNAPAVLSWSTSTLTNDTLNLAAGHIAIVWASCAMNGGSANKDAFINPVAPADQLGHDAVIGLSFEGFVVPPGPQNGQPNFEDQTLVLASGSAVPINYRMVSADGIDRAIHRIYLAALAFAV